MAARGKARAVARDGKVSLCVLDERWPFAYLQVYADAVIERDRDLVVDVMMAGAERMSGQRLGEEARPYVEAMAVREDRVAVRCRPYATFAQPPRHLYNTTIKPKKSLTGCRPRSRGMRQTRRECDCVSGLIV